MRYNVSINGKKYIVEVERAQGVYKQMQRHPLGTVAAAPAVSTVATETPVAAPKAAPAPAPAPVPAPAPKAAPAPAPAPAAAPAAGNGTEIPSPMPGTVFDIRVNAGDTVAAGQVVIVLEAMKMEIEVVAPQAGTIDKLLVAKGDAVDTGAALAILK